MRLLIGIVIGLVAFALLHFSGLLLPVEDGLRAAFLPFARGTAAVGGEIRRRTNPVESSLAAEQRLQDLQARLSSLSVDYVKLRALEEENRNLKDIGKFLKDSSFDHLGARVIARNVDSKHSTLLIDRGSKDGLESGMAVVVNEGIFVGKITSLSSRVSVVTLVSDERSRVAASLAGQKRLLGLIEGRGDQVAKLTLVPQSQDLKRNDLIVTAGTEEKVPPNLVIGAVDEVEGRPTDPFKTASLEPFSEAERIDLVVVLRPAALRPDDQNPAP